jgi:hypothetical protein
MHWLCDSEYIIVSDRIRTTIIKLMTRRFKSDSWSVDLQMDLYVAYHESMILKEIRNYAEEARARCDWALLARILNQLIVDRIEKPNLEDINSSELFEMIKHTATNEQKSIKRVMQLNIVNCKYRIKLINWIFKELK